MRYNTKLNLICVALLALLAGSASAGTNSTTTTDVLKAISKDNNGYLAPSHDSYRDDNPKCGTKEGAYMVSPYGKTQDTCPVEDTYLAPLYFTCRDGMLKCKRIKDAYMITILDETHKVHHIRYLEQNFEHDVLKNWYTLWIDDDVHVIKNISRADVEVLRKNTSVKEVEELYTAQMDILDVCTNPHLTDEDKKGCYEEQESKTTIPIDDTMSIAHLIYPWDNCKNKGCGYMIRLHAWQTRASHLSYLKTHFAASVIDDWHLEWYDNDEFYLVKEISREEIYLIMEDPGVEEVEQNYWFTADTGVNWCVSSRLTEEKRRQCYKDRKAQD